MRPLENTLRQVITELQVIWPDSIIETEFELTELVTCDNKRMAQLFSNLLSNALAHGKADTAVKVQAVSSGGEFRVYQLPMQGKKSRRRLWSACFSHSRAEK